MLRRALVLSLVLLSAPAVAGPSVQVGWLWSPKSRLKERVGQRNVDDAKYRAFAWRLGYRWDTETHGQGGVRLGYTHRSIDRKCFSCEVSGPWPQDLYTLFGRAEWQHRMSPDYEWAAYLVSAYENASENASRARDWNLGLGLLVRRQLQLAAVGVGVDWNRSFVTKILMPVLEVRSESSRFIAHALLPLEATVRFQWRPGLEVGVMAWQQGGEYRADNEDSEISEWVRYWSTTVGSGIAVALGATDISLAIRGGLEFWRRFDGVDSDGKRTKREFERAPSVELSIRFGNDRDKDGQTVVWGWN